jgi:1-aminocyclopropane-1-carboxylate deaminase/D-cysteine desulfhydrase-like pyridoxal-dependent ACC family enzyme
MNILKSTIVVASGSGITQAGLILGVKTSNDIAIDIHGICVRRERNLQKQRLTHILQSALTMLDNPETVKAEDISLCDHYLDSSHGVLGKQTKAAILLGAREEGIILGPVYTGKTFSGLLDLAKQSHLDREPLIFLHTGGLPILFAYPDKLYP